MSPWTTWSGYTLCSECGCMLSFAWGSEGQPCLEHPATDKCKYAGLKFSFPEVELQETK